MCLRRAAMRLPGRYLHAIIVLSVLVAGAGHHAAPIRTVAPSTEKALLPLPPMAGLHANKGLSAGLRLARLDRVIRRVRFPCLIRCFWQKVGETPGDAVDIGQDGRHDD